MRKEQQTLTSAILPLALTAAALVDVRPDGAKLSVDCFELPLAVAAAFLAGAFLVAGWLDHRINHA